MIFGTSFMINTGLKNECMHGCSMMNCSALELPEEKFHKNSHQRQLDNQLDNRLQVYHWQMPNTNAQNYMNVSLTLTVYSEIN